MYNGDHAVIFINKAGEEKHSYDDWCLIPSGRPTIVPPPPQEFTVEIPGRSGKLDFGDVIHSHPVYNNRQGSLEFIVDHDATHYINWSILYDMIMTFLHGFWIKVVLTDDPDWYYQGRLSVNEFKSNADWSTITIDYDLQPYKYSNLAASDAWLWDPFSFINGYIHKPEDFKLNLTTDSGSTSITIPTMLIDTEIELKFHVDVYATMHVIYKTLTGHIVDKVLSTGFNSDGSLKEETAFKFVLPSSYSTFSVSVSTSGGVGKRPYLLEINFDGAML